MLYTITVLAIYTIIILLFVPLDKIGEYQVKVKKQYKKLIDKINK